MDLRLGGGHPIVPANKLAGVDEMRSAVGRRSHRPIRLAASAGPGSNSRPTRAFPFDLFRSSGSRTGGDCVDSPARRRNVRNPPRRLSVSFLPESAGELNGSSLRGEISEYSRSASGIHTGG